MQTHAAAGGIIYAVSASSKLRMQAHRPPGQLKCSVNSIYSDISMLYSYNMVHAGFNLCTAEV